jgi:hypothetical protein
MNKRFIITLSMLVFLPLASGCVALVAGGAGAGSVAYIRGDLQAHLEASLSRSVTATNRAIKSLKYVKISEATDKLASRIVARNARDKKIEINLDKATKNTTSISIRVGMFGDQVISNNLLNEINKRL